MTRMTSVRAMACAVLALTVAACSDSTEKRTEEAARDAGRATSEAARDAGAAVANAGRAADAAVETMDVKAALMRDNRVDAGEINVDTNHQTKTVVLKGKVPTAAQKALAEQIAAEQATGYRIQNELTVGQ